MSEEFTEKDIEYYYNQHVKLPFSYFQSIPASMLPPKPEFTYQWTVGDYPRLRTILDFQTWIQKYSLSTPNHLAFTCDSDPEYSLLSPLQKTYIPYPPYNLHEISKHYTNTFDMFLFSQTLEHLYNPFKAMEEIYKTLQPGGIVFTSVPTLAIPHNTPIHFTGFTPMGLAMLFLSTGFEILEMGQWGSQIYIQEHWKGQRWPGAVDLAPFYPDGMIPNEENCCVQCWILAKKPD